MSGSVVTAATAAATTSAETGVASSTASGTGTTALATRTPTPAPSKYAHDCPHAWQLICHTHYPWQADELRARWDAAGAPIWLDDDVFMVTVVWQGEADEVYLRGTLERPLTRLDGTDLWAITLRIGDIPTGLIEWGIAAFVGDKAVNDIDQRQQWRGPDAPAALDLPADLAGTMQDFSLEIAGIGARAVSVWLPPDFDRSQTYPVVYLADGQTTAGFSAAIDGPITRGELPAVVLIGVHAANGDDDPRSQEYLVTVNDERFAAHEHFFVEELPAWARANFNVTTDRAHVAVFGFSSGASYAVSLGVRHPEVYGTALAFSHGWDRGFRDPNWPNGNIPAFYFVNGTLEEACHTTAAWAA